MGKVKTYKKDVAEKLSKNFNSKEFDCHGKGCCSETQVDEQLVEYVQKIRDHFGKPVNISSGYRCAKHNKSVGGATASRHAKGQAADIYIDGVAPAEIAKYAESIGIKGIGLYETKADGFFVHVDTRETKYFWYGQAQKYRETFGGRVEEPKVEKVKEIEPPKIEEPKMDPYMAEVTASRLNYRTGPSLSYKIISTFKKGEKIEIVEEKDGWGRVENKGWVSLQYVKKLQTAQTGVQYVIYKVKKNDSLWSIAAKYLGDGNRYKEIMALNGLTSDMIRTNQTLKIPVK